MGYDLEKFVTAQSSDYERALAEIKNGRKTSHWIWYIFPQLGGLGKSYMSQMYGISDLDEARAYFAHPILGMRLIEITKALLDLESNDPIAVMGSPVDAKKLKSSMTLFANAAPENDIFQRVLDKYFGGKYDYRTLDRL